VTASGIWTGVLGILAISAAGHSFGACTFGSGSGEQTLQGVFDSILPAGTIDAVNDCLLDGNDSVWRQVGGSPTATIIVELAGFANQNVFGIYDATDPSNSVSIFSGPMSTGSSAVINIAGGLGGFDILVNGATAGNFQTSSFGFFLTTPQNNDFFSDSSLNADGADHMFAYQGLDPAVSFLSSSALAGESFSTLFYLLAFEDLEFPGSDGDYQDFVVGARFIAPVPLPSAAALLAGAFLLLRVLTRERGAA